MQVYFWALYSIPLTYVSVFGPVPYCFDYYSIVLWFEVRESFSFVIIIIIIFWKMLSCLGFVVVSYKFQSYLFSVKNVMDILIGIALNLQSALASTDILTVLILLIHKHRLSFHLFVSFSISFINHLKVSEYWCFTLVKFIHGYFILCDSITNGIVFIIFLIVHYLYIGMQFISVY